MHCYTQCPHPCSRPSPTHASARDSWTLMGKSGSVSYGVTVPFSWVLVHTRFCLCPPRVCFLVLCKFWQLCGGVNGDLLQEGFCHTQICCTQRPCSRPPLTHGFTGDSWTPTDKSWIVSCGVTVPFSWVLVNRFCCALQESISQSCVSSGSFMVGLMVISYKRTYAIPTARAPVPAADHCRTSTGDAQTLFCLSLWHLWVLVCSRFA